MYPQFSVTDDDWLHILDYFRKQKLVADSDYYSKAAALFLLDSQRYKSLKISDTDADHLLNVIKLQIHEDKIQSDPVTLLKNLYILKILFPDKFTEVKLADSIKHTIAYTINHFANLGKWGFFRDMAYYMYFVLPHMLFEFQDTRAISGMEFVLMHFRRENRWSDAIKMAATVHLLYPQVLKDELIPQDQWVGAKGWMDKCRKDELWGVFIVSLLYLYIMTDKIKP